MDSLPIALPAALAEQKRPPLPLLAAFVPVLAGVVMWLVTGSIFALCFAAIGPLMLVASLIDGARARRKAGRLAARESETAWAAVGQELNRRHDEEREIRTHRLPDAASCLVRPPLRGSEGIDAETPVVIGRGAVRSEVRSSGGGDERARAFESKCRVLHDAPVSVPLGAGVCLRGAAPLSLAVLRALVTQLSLRFGSAQLAVFGEHLPEWGLDGFSVRAHGRRGAFRLAVVQAGDERPPCDAAIWVVPPDMEVPEGITTVIDLIEPRRASVRTPHGVVEVVAEGLSRAQAAAAADARASVEGDLDVLPDAVALAELSTPQASGRGLAAALGRGLRDDVALDIVEDGPHAIVTGTTGTGKSELLVTWVASIARSHGPERVVFVLADFKGGTAFEPLRALPHVTAVITDLDDEGARRGVSSLTAELRRREGVLAAAGARDVDGVDLPRLVIVVDEFAALLHEHADLGAVFTDIAARGRALGMHLVIGTQRASGVIRDALAANCPLRVSLRVSDAADSRSVIGSEAAAEIPGGPGSRGLALVRRPQDAEPVAMRVALTGTADLRSSGMRWAAVAPPSSPWLPGLAACIPLEDLRGEAPEGALILGRSDDPEHQRQPVELLRAGEDRGFAVLGAPGSGRTTVLRSLARQCDGDVLWIPHDPEEAWDAVTDLASGRRRPPRLLLCDDVDVLLAELPPDHAQRLGQDWERILRWRAGTTVVLAAARANGATGRLLDALPRRALLRMPSRVEHLAAGGDSSGYDRDRAPGRARLGDREMQFAWLDPLAAPVAETPGTLESWSPTAVVTALVTSNPHSVARALRVALPDCEIVLVPAEPVGEPGRMVLVADTDTWQRNWTLWQRVRAEGEVLIRAENPTDLRQLAGVREVPPFATPHRGRAWAWSEAAEIRRVVIEPLRDR